MKFNILTEHYRNIFTLDRETVRREGEDHAQPPLAAVHDLGLDPEDQVGGEIGQGFSILHFITNFHGKWLRTG